MHIFGLNPNMCIQGGLDEKGRSADTPLTKEEDVSILTHPLLVLISSYRLLTQAESLDEFTITIDVLVVKILKELTTATYQLGQRTSSTEVLVVLLQVLGEVLNAISEQGYLALNRTGILGVLAVLAENLSLLCLI